MVNVTDGAYVHVRLAAIKCICHTFGKLINASDKDGLLSLKIKGALRTREAPFTSPCPRKSVGSNKKSAVLALAIR